MIADDRGKTHEKKIWGPKIGIEIRVFAKLSLWWRRVFGRDICLSGVYKKVKNLWMVKLSITAVIFRFAVVIF